ncbi:B3 domain-containing protein Os07g0563300-like isoform X1 [Rhododendron vialii]|uniref:B3 domain-containing protein Os07g0563300-like isoform X1 n=1 Tax=Rhododendron vialii TaxID=182163 RepID=UPI00265E4F38|nr:B3 domain-containing protein Os07g0563300-like isoform X1 [Rhododendron vialii]
MASSSSTKACFQCRDSNSTHFRNGWRLRSGQFAQLCNRCASLYEEGRFCETFHSNDEGWRDCESCGKQMVHCGCIVSFLAFTLLDFGGVVCMQCSRMNFILARKRCLHSETQIGNGETQGDAAKRIQIDPQYWPRVTDLELQQIGRKTKSVVIPLFEKLLSASDADHKLARLVIPKRCAEAFFPQITSPHGCPVKIQDTEGKEWGFHFCYWLNNGSKMYVLEGLKDYIGSMQWQAGDIVTFYRIEPEKKLVMGLRKTCAGVTPYEVKGNVH